jgi:adenylate kinase family enzyme
MNRILVLGGPGAGKSTFAREIGALLGLKVVHLDVLNFHPGWIETDTEVFRARIEEAISGGRWVTDGNYVGKTADLRLARADAIIWLDQPRRLRMARAIRRTLRRSQRPDMAEGCAERLNWTFLSYAWTFDRKKKESILGRVRKMAPHIPVTYLRGDREISGFLADISRQRKSGAKVSD